MDEYGNEDDWTSNYDENSYYSPDEPQQSVASISNDNSYDLPDYYDEPNTFGYGQSNIDYSQYNPYAGDWQEQLGLTPNSTPVPNSQPDWYSKLMAGEGNATGQALSSGSLSNMSLPNVPKNQQPSGGITSLLSQLFSGAAKGIGGVGTKIAGALAEGQQNKQKQQALNTVAKNPALDPFGQTQRNFYQEQAQQLVKDPFSAPIVKVQTDELLRQANIRNAAHGRTMYQGGPELVAAQAGIAQKYLDQMLHAGGSQMTPDGKTITGLQSGASQAGINGYTSPLASAIGYAGQSSNNEDSIMNILKLLANSKPEDTPTDNSWKQIAASKMG